MKKLVLPALLIGLGQVTACAPLDDEGDVDVVWNFTAGIDDDRAGSCADFLGDFVTVRAEDVFTGEVFLADFPCENGGGVIVGLPDSDYDMSLTIDDVDGLLAAESFVQTDVPVIGGAITDVDFFLASDGGYLGLLWDLEEVDINGDTVGALSCDEINADGVQLRAIEINNQKPDNVIIFPCQDLEFFAEGKLFFGIYDIEIDLVQGEDILTLEPVLKPDVTINVANEVEDLGETIFEFDLGA